MDRFCHLNLTKKWALEEGYSLTQSEEIAKSCWHFDCLWWAKPWAHFFLFGANLFSWLFFWLALIFKTENLLGYSIHTKQDAIAHGLTMPWNHRKYSSIIDSWESADEDKRAQLEKATRRLLKKAQQRLVQRN